MVCKGETFPFWMRGQALLILKVTTAAPDDVVRLVPGAEVSIAPRPRVRKQQASGTPQSVPAADGEKPELPPAWFRIQVPYPDPSCCSSSMPLLFLFPDSQTVCP